jgi:hypothetical protein
MIVITPVAGGRTRCLPGKHLLFSEMQITASAAQSGGCRTLVAVQPIELRRCNVFADVARGTGGLEDGTCSPQPRASGRWCQVQPAAEDPYQPHEFSEVIMWYQAKVTFM